MYPKEAIYADDADFINIYELRDKKITNIVGQILNEDNLIVNESKTEHTKILRSERNRELWRNVKKLGSLLGNDEGITNRKNLATSASMKVNQISVRGIYIRLEERLQLYNSIVKSVLLYNSETWGLTKSAIKNLNSCRRKQLRIVLNIRHPHHITNKAVYEICKTEPLSLEVLMRRWRYLGHVLRLDRNTPAAKAMKFYFIKIEGSKKFRGRPRNTIVITLNNDMLSLFYSNSTAIEKYNIKKITSNFELENLRRLAFERNVWKELTKELYRVARAEGSFHWD